MSSSATTFDYVITALYSLGYVLMQILYYASQVLVGLWRVISLIIVKPITTVLYILALPALYFGGWVGSLIGYISDFLKGFEALWTFLGTAALMGTIAGLIMFGVSTGATKLLGWESTPEDYRPKEKVRSVQQYREDRQRKKQRRANSEMSMLDLSYASSSTLVEGSTKGRSKWTDRGLYSPTTILEEEDSEE